MQALVLVINILLILNALVLIVAVLMQQGNRAGLGAIGGGAETFFGKSKAKSYEGKLELITKIGATTFIVLAIAMTAIASRMPDSVTPVAPAPTATATAEPTATPAADETATPAPEATEEPTAAPTEEPTVAPTAVPTAKPTAEPAAAATDAPVETQAPVATAPAQTDPVQPSEEPAA